MRHILFLTSLRRVIPAILIVSTLIAIRAQSTDLVPSESTWRFHIGETPPSPEHPTAWRDLDFPDTQWATGTDPFHTEKFQGNTTVDLSTATSLFLRHRFQVPSPEAFESLTLTSRIDDGFVAWINGMEVTRQNVPSGEIRFDSRASRGAREPIQATTHEIRFPRSLLRTGSNVLAIQALNSSRPSSRADLYVEMSLVGHLDDSPPRIESRLPEAGSLITELKRIEIFFDDAVTGVDAADLFIAEQPAQNLTQITPSHFLFEVAAPSIGEILIRWSPDHGIQDLAGNAFEPSDWNYTIDPTISLSQIRINEFVASNDRSFNDENGDRSDWLELYNGSEAAISLEGWGLSDTPDLPFKWTLPDFILPAGGYRIIFASGKDRSPRFGEWHTNFKLSAQGEWLSLTEPSGQPIHTFAPGYPEQFADVSYGLVPGTDEDYGYFVSPTPGDRNSTAGQGFSPEVHFSRASRPFSDPFELTLQAPDETVQIRYTTDGRTPTRSSIRYTSPIAIDDSVEIRARAFHPMLLPGPIRSETFTRLAPEIQAFRSDLPLMIISRLGSQRIGATRNTPVHFAVFEPKGGHAYLNALPDFAHRGAAKTRGSSTGGLQKSSWAIEWRDEFEEDEDHPVLGMPADSEWVLYAPNQFDPVMIHNPFVHQLSRNNGYYSPRTRFIEVFLNEGGPLSESQYEGLYVLEEKISIGRNRVDIDKLRPENTTPPEVTGGYLLKIDRPDPGDTGVAAWGTRVLFVDPKERAIESPRGRPPTPQWLYISQALNQFYDTLRSDHWRDPEIGYRSFIDTDQWIDFHILEVLSGNVDTLVLSTYFHKPRGGPFRYGPHWDFDRALGSTDGRNANPANWNNGPSFSSPPFSQLLQDPDFWQQWIDRWQELRKDEYSLTALNALIDAQTDEVRTAIPRELARWRTRMRGGTFDAEITHMKTWLERRIRFIDGQITAPPEFSLDAGLVDSGQSLTLSGPDDAVIYYTLDGSDPRLPGGERSRQARRFSRPIPIDQHVVITARAFSESSRQTAVRQNASTPWSRPEQAAYHVALPELRLSEIMYHPATEPGDSPADTEALQFLELMNVGTSPVSLRGLHFTRGIRYQFTESSAVQELGPGGRLVLARNAERLQPTLPPGTLIMGDFEGNLANDGDRIILADENGGTVFDVRYRDEWFPLTDGIGHSLVAANPHALERISRSSNDWTASAFSGGSPGLPNPQPEPSAPIFINEIQAAPPEGEPDVVEFYNPGAEPQDIGGWFLSDAPNQPRKHKVPAGNVIPSGGYLVLLGNELTPPLQLDRSGETLTLYAANLQSLLTGWSHTVRFRGSATGVSYGRYVDATGQEHFMPQQSPSMGALNPGPIDPPASIASINYIARNRDGSNNASFEFIELINRTNEPLPLHDPQRPEVGWRLANAIEYEFPPAYELGPNESVVVIGFSPLTEPVRLSDLKQTYGISNDTRFVGPWNGDLNNQGESIELLQPVPNRTQDSSVFQRVEVVPYQPTEPWPQIPPSSTQILTRRNPITFAGSSASWASGHATLGDVDLDQDGLPDAWERQFGLLTDVNEPLHGAEGDLDQDGLSNRAELEAGTNPSDPESNLRIHLTLEEYPLRFSTRREPILLTVQTVPGRRYSIYASTRLDDPDWEWVTGFIGAPDSETTVVRDGLKVRGREHRFYQVVTP